jgi:CRP-like cAMP-binding protein
MQDILFDFISKYVSLTEDEKNAIVSLDIFRSVKKGTTLLKEGQRSQESYFVLKGCIRVYYIKAGDEKTTAFYTEMDALTPHSVINKTPSDYFISCVEDSILLVSNSDMTIYQMCKELVATVLYFWQPRGIPVRPHILPRQQINIP